jgi:phosphate/phosphite/phosphonate ABC transporter binding protein
MRLSFILLMTMGCTDNYSNARRLIAKTPESVIYAQAKEAMKAEGIDHLTWCVTPYVTPDGGVEEGYVPTIALVAERLKTPMSVVAGKSYADVEQQLLAGTIDVAVMSPYAYVRAHAKNSKIRAIATHIANGTETYGAYILTQEDSEYQTLNDLRGEPFGFVDKRSSSGWLFPASRMLDEGVNPLKDIEGKFYGDHESVIKAISSGEVAAGATYSGALKAGRGNIFGANSLRVMARTERIPYDAYVVRAGLPAEAIVGIQNALSSVSTRDSRGRNALLPLDNINGFIRSDDAHYRGVREVEARVQSLLTLPGGRLPIAVYDEDKEDIGP